MAFIGRLRKIVRGGRNSSTGVIDAASVSRNILKETERLNLRNLDNLFSTKYVINKGNDAFIGLVDMDKFVRFSRLGDYTNSFQAAYRNTDLLASSGVQRSVRKVLDDAAASLPDSGVLKADTALKRTKLKYGMGEVGKNNFTTVAELDTFVKKNPELEGAVNKVVTNTKRTGYLKMFGYSVAISGGVVTAALIYDKLLTESKNSSGCFSYTKTGNEVVKCKVSKYSCKHPKDGKLCADVDLPASIVNDTTACTGDNANKECDESRCNSDNFTDLKDNQILRCESKTVSDVLGEAINAVGAGATSFVTGALGSIFIWLAIAVGVIAGIVVIVKVIFPMLLNAFKGSSDKPAQVAT